MAKTLELQFITELGKSARLTVDNPKEPIDVAAVKQSMEQIIALGVFFTTGGNLVKTNGARVVERNVIDYQVS